MRASWLLFLPLLGCASATEIHGPQGQIGYLIECPGSANSMGACYSKANKMCPAGYAVVDAQQSPGAVAITQFGVTQGVNRQLVVQCAR